MSEIIEVAELSIEVTRKAVKHAHLSVHPPDGRVTLVIPGHTRLTVARAFAVSKLGWIRDQREQLVTQVREPARRYIERESHHVWGKRYLLTVREADAKPFVKLDHKRITLTVRPGATADKRADVMHDWHKALLHELIPARIMRWEPELGVEVDRYYLQRMKTRWGSCNPHSRCIRLNTELVKKPKDLLDYVIVHEMAHLREPNHGERFVEILDRHFPVWRDARAELNALPLSSIRAGDSRR